MTFDAYEAVVFDLDGTLVHLDVDWDAVDEAVREVLSEHGVATATSTAWDLYDDAETVGRADDVEAIIASHERDGATRARRLPLADRLPVGVPTAVCSLNCEQAVRTALDDHGLATHVQVVVGRDTTGARKPDPRPLLAAIEGLGADPERTLFVGDSARDEETARRAGVEFAYVVDLLEVDRA
ncbi:MAG: HAD family hydrolase [Halobacteriaceae archaeon]